MLSTTDDVLDFMDSYFTSAALVAALELGLFWLLEKKPLTSAAIAETLDIPIKRCRYWLQLLSKTGLIVQHLHEYSITQATRTAILDTYSRDTWVFLAKEARERFPGLRDLSLHIRNPGSAWKALGLTPGNYVGQMAESADQTRHFTRMLYELHCPLGDILAESLDMTDVTRIMDLGGGSGVISMALLRRHPHLTATVVDIPSVCSAGREIAAEQSLGHRISYHATDFLRDELPSGFDMVLECDVDVYSEALFRKVYNALKPGGRFIVVDQLAPAEDAAPASRVHWALQNSMIDPEFTFLTVSGITQLMRKTGFDHLFDHPLHSTVDQSRRFMDGMILIEAKTCGSSS